MLKEAIMFDDESLDFDYQNVADPMLLRLDSVGGSGSGSDPASSPGGTGGGAMSDQVSARDSTNSAAVFSIV